MALNKIQRQMLDDNVVQELNNTAAQLADIAINVAGYCGTLDVMTDNTQGILNAIADVKNTKQKKLVFSDGVYAYSSHLLIDNLDKITLELSPNAKLYDLGKDVSTNSGTKKAPAGLKILNVKEVTIKNINHDSAVTSETNTVTTVSERVPHLDVEGAEIVNVEGGLLESYSGLGIGGLPAYTETDIMREFYIRIIRCGNVSVSKVELASESGKGEIFGFYDCDVVTWEHCKHTQVGTESTFWSFGKVIKCNELNFGKHTIKSNSTGSLVDVIALKSHFYDMNVDYINGKFADISNEWKQFNVVQEEVSFKNCFSNGFGVQSTLDTTETTNNKKIKKLTIDNCLFAKTLTSGNLLKLTMFESIEIKNCNVDSLRYLVDGRLTGDYTNFDRDIKIKRCDFAQDYSPVYMNSIYALGKVTISNCNFKFTNAASLEVVDSKLALSSQTDISLVTNPSQVVFENCYFEGVKITIGCNTSFKNCEFSHVNSSTDTQFIVNNNATVTILNSEGYKYSVPISRYFPKDVFVRCTDKGEKGTSPNKYVILGWQRLTNGTGHVLNTDWRELRAFTGN